MTDVAITRFDAVLSSRVEIRVTPVTAQITSEPSMAPIAARVSHPYPGSSLLP